MGGNVGRLRVNEGGGRDRQAGAAGRRGSIKPIPGVAGVEGIGRAGGQIIERSAGLPVPRRCPCARGIAVLDTAHAAAVGHGGQGDAVGRHRACAGWGRGSAGLCFWGKVGHRHRAIAVCVSIQGERPVAGDGAVVGERLAGGDGQGGPAGDSHGHALGDGKVVRQGQVAVDLISIVSGATGLDARAVIWSDGGIGATTAANIKRAACACYVGQDDNRAACAAGARALSSTAANIHRLYTTRTSTPRDRNTPAQKKNCTAGLAGKITRSIT